MTCIAVFSSKRATLNRRPTRLPFR